MLNILVAILGGFESIIAIYHFIKIRRWKKRINWDDALRNAKKVLEKIQDYHLENEWKPDIVIGLGRSGGIWGGWLAGNLGTLPFAVVDNEYKEEKDLKVDFPGGEGILSTMRSTYPEKKRILVVQGASSFGITFSKFQEKFSNTLKDCEIRYAVLYMSHKSNFDIDFVGEIGPEPWPKKFPWHYKEIYRPYLRDIFTSHK